MQEGLEPKKLALLRILEILESDSDCDHPLTQQQIADRLGGKVRDRAGEKGGVEEPAAAGGGGL